MDALQVRQEQMLQFVAKRLTEYITGLANKDIETLMSYSGHFDGSRYVITDKAGAEVDPTKLSPECVRSFWISAVDSVGMTMSIQSDWPESMQAARVILPYLHQDSLKAAQRGDTARVDHRQPQIVEWQAKQDALFIPAVKAAENLIKGRSKTQRDKKQKTRDWYQGLIDQGCADKAARIQTAHEFGITERTVYRHLSTGKENQ